MGSITNIGVTLKTARESFNKSLFDLSKLTNLSVKQLTLLEENKFDEIGEGVFVIGFLRIYAKVLRINPNLIIDAYKSNYDNVSLKQSSKYVDDSGNSKSKNVIFLKNIFITIFVIVIVSIFIFLIKKNKLISTKINSKDETQQIGDLPEEDINTGTQMDQLIDLNDSPDYDALENYESGKINLRLVFTEECWIEIKDINGNIVNSSFNLPDTELTIESSLPLSFIFGNSEGVSLYLSGVIFDHKPFTKVSVARFTISNNE